MGPLITHRGDGQAATLCKSSWSIGERQEGRADVGDNGKVA